MSKNLIETRCNIFCLNTFGVVKTRVTVSVREYEYANKEKYYYIDYTFNPKNNILPKDHETGEIIYKNNMTAEMINFLLMEDEELEGKTGNTTISDYRQFIMQSLSKFWD